MVSEGKVYTVKKKPRGVLGLRSVTAQGVLWQHTIKGVQLTLADYARVLAAYPTNSGVLRHFNGVLSQH